jgi:predicted TIM-barrel fold metal-dependent hydrolase
MNKQPLIDNHVHIGVDPLFYLNGWSPYCLDLPRLLIEAGGSGIDEWVVFPFVAYFALDAGGLRCGEIFLPEADPEIPYVFENRRLRDDLGRLEAAQRARFRQFLMADPGRLPAAQVADWERLEAGGARFHGVKIQATILRSKIDTLGGAAACMLDFAAARNLPLLIHSSIDPADPWSQCADILRVAENRPDVRFVLAHSCRFHKPGLDRVAALPNTWFDCSAHIIHCDCAVRGLPAVAAAPDRFDSDYTNPKRVLRDLAEAYPDKFIWGSDAPFYSYEDATLQLRSSYREEAAALRALPDELVNRVARRNTLAWLEGTTT